MNQSYQSSPNRSFDGNTSGARSGNSSSLSKPVRDEMLFDSLCRRRPMRTGRTRKMSNSAFQSLPETLYLIGKNHHFQHVNKLPICLPADANLDESYPRGKDPTTMKTAPKFFDCTRCQ